MMAEKASYWFVDGHAEPLCEKVSVLIKKIDLNTGEDTLTVKVHSQPKWSAVKYGSVQDSQI